jgi:hypothetical protein
MVNTITSSPLNYLPCLLEFPPGGLVTAWEVHAPPRLLDVVDEEEHNESLPDEDEDDHYPTNTHCRKTGNS